MKLFHYTTIQTLALILENKTMRFTRLDQLDDFYEMGIYKSEYTKNTFVSCWSERKDGAESIPQWSLYGGNKKGVIIGLNQSFIDFPSPIEHKEINGINYYALENPITSNCAFPMEYHEFEKLKELAETKEVINEYGGVEIYGQLGNYKSKLWEFQKEYRYSISVVRWDSENFKQGIPMQQQIIPDIPYWDLSLKKGFENDIEVVLGPLCDESHKIIVEALLHKYRIKKSLQTSSLKGIITK